jgi:hypothetical protein
MRVRRSYGAGGEGLAPSSLNNAKPGIALTEESLQGVVPNTFGYCWRTPVGGVRLGFGQDGTPCQGVSPGSGRSRRIRQQYSFVFGNPLGNSLNLLENASETVPLFVPKSRSRNFAEAPSSGTTGRPRCRQRNPSKIRWFWAAASWSRWLSVVFCPFTTGCPSVERRMRPLKMSPQRRRTARIRGDFVAPNRKAKSLTISREHREPSKSARKTNVSEVFRYFALSSTNVGFRP